MILPVYFKSIEIIVFENHDVHHFQYSQIELASISTYLLESQYTKNLFFKNKLSESSA